jgi:uncharacterized membrane protein YsdA (DUF1294 family)
MEYLLLYLLLINALGFLLMLVDKWKAKNKRWRIPEATLLGVAAIGGSVGSLLGMHIFRHKTRHPRFSLGIPLMLAVHLAALAYLFV